MSDAPEHLTPERARARACGLALLDASRCYETFELPVGEDDAATVLALVLAARGHLQAAYLLADAGLELEAIVVRRTLIEYVLKVNWLLDDRHVNLRIWNWDDARTRLQIDDDARPFSGEVLTAEERVRQEDKQARLAAELDADEIAKGISGMKDLAALAGMGYAYVAYRFDSQFTHPSTIAAQQLKTTQPDGTIRLHAQKPQPDEHVDTYPVCAWLLLGLLAAVDQVFDPPRIEAGRLDKVHADLESLRRSA